MIPEVLAEVGTIAAYARLEGGTYNAGVQARLQDGREVVVKISPPSTGPGLVYEVGLLPSSQLPTDIRWGIGLVRGGDTGPFAGGERLEPQTRDRTSEGTRLGEPPNCCLRSLASDGDGRRRDRRRRPPRDSAPAGGLERVRQQPWSGAGLGSRSMASGGNRAGDPRRGQLAGYSTGTCAKTVQTTTTSASSVSSAEVPTVRDWLNALRWCWRRAYDEGPRSCPRSSLAWESC